MKAKDYAKMYFESINKEDELVKIAKLFLNEISELVKMRNAKKDKTLIPVLEELNKKWGKYVEIVNTGTTGELLKYSGFTAMVRKFLPDVYDLWQNGKRP